MRRKTITIPDDLHMEILKFLPSKTLMRFRFVSKSWNLTIRDPNFAKIHKTISKTRPGATTIILLSTIRDGQKVYFYKINRERELIHELTIDATRYGFNNSSRVSEIVNGLVCLSKFQHAIVCNITTHEVISLPRQPISDSNPIYSLVYDPLSNEYKVLCFIKRPDFCKCMAVTIGKSKIWREVSDPLDRALVPMNCLPGHVIYRDVVYNDGVLYWLTGQPYRRKMYGMVSFDVKEEKFRVIVVPCESPYLFLLRLGGCIVVHDYRSRLSFEYAQKNQVWNEMNIQFLGREGHLIGSVADNLIYAYWFRRTEIARNPTLGGISRIFSFYNPKSGELSYPIESGQNIVKGSIGSTVSLSNYSMCEVVEDIYPLLQK